MLHLLPTDSDDAPGNMARDLLLLEEYPAPEAFRMRHYGWREPAVTFGYSQPFAAVRALVPTTVNSLVRRPTGGGVVDHRNDWTFALVIPASHPLARARASEPYRIVHTALAGALRELGQESVLHQPSAKPQVAPTGRLSVTIATENAPPVPELAQCFVEPSPDDIMARDGQKIAGAALKRTRHGLLLQGSIARAAAPAVCWDLLLERFASQLAAALDLRVIPPGPRPFPTASLERMRAHFADESWNRRR